MGAKPYPAYRDSGVEWIGDIPEHWEVSRIGNVLFGVYSGGTPTSDRSEYYSEDGVCWVNISDITRDPAIKSTSKRLSAAGVQNKSLKILPVGTILLSMYASLGKPAKLFVPATISQAILALFPKPLLSDDYLVRVLEHNLLHLELYSTSNTQANLSAERVRRIPIVLPPLEEQKQIASFLDRETSKIDILIGKQQQLINLLKEKRGSLISHTVTKGLNPNAPMKDSGVEWIGEIPEHWEVKRLKDACVQSALYGANIAATDYVQDGVRFLRTTDITDNGNLIASGVYVPKSLALDYMLQTDDILISRSGTVGRALLFNKNLHGECSYAGYLVRFIPGRSLYPRFFFLFTKSAIFGDFLKLTAISSTIENVNGEKYANCAFPSPSLEEQKQIAAFLDRETSKIDTLIEKANQSIALLKERRSSLISAAVTGKIDVREAA